MLQMHLADSTARTAVSDSCRTRRRPAWGNSKIVAISIDGSILDQYDLAWKPCILLRSRGANFSPPPPPRGRDSPAAHKHQPQHLDLASAMSVSALSCRLPGQARIANFSIGVPVVEAWFCAASHRTSETSQSPQHRDAAVKLGEQMRLMFLVLPYSKAFKGGPPGRKPGEILGIAPQVRWCSRGRRSKEPKARKNCDPIQSHECIA